MTRFSIPKLDYEYDALEPHLDKDTMVEHHTKHHNTYAKNSNNLSECVSPSISMHDLLSGLLSKDNTSALSEVDRDVVIKYVAGHYNHSLFWLFLTPPSQSNKKDISEFLEQRIKVDFGDLDTFKEMFSAKAKGIFGSGWVWWYFDVESKRSYISCSKDQENPLMYNKDAVILLAIDVWEHAYYLKYKSDRGSFIKAFWDIVNWKRISYIHEKIVLQGKKLELTDKGEMIY